MADHPYTIWVVGQFPGRAFFVPNPAKYPLSRVSECARGQSGKGQADYIYSLADLTFHPPSMAPYT